MRADRRARLLSRWAHHPAEVLLACAQLADEAAAVVARAQNRDRQRRFRDRRRAQLAALQAAVAGQAPGSPHDRAEGRPILSLPADQAGTLNN